MANHFGLLSLIRIVLVSLLLVFPLTAGAQEQAQPPSENSTISTRENAPEDRDIDLRIEEIFDEIEGLENVNSSVRSGVVTLRGTVSEAAVADEAERLAGRVEGVVAVKNEIQEITEVSQRLEPLLARFAKRLQTAYDYLPLIMFAFFVWLIVSGLGWFITSAKRPWSWMAPNAFITELLRQIVFLAFILLGLVLALDILDATAVLGTILGAAGIFGLAIGFAVRDTVENYIASILLSIRQPFRPKDLIGLEGFEGHVLRLTSRATILMDRDGNHIRIPNSTVYKSVIANYTRNPERRFSFRLGIDADSDLQQALAVCMETFEKLEFVLKDPAPAVMISEVGDSNVVLELTGWINQIETDFIKARSEAIRLAKEALETNGFALPEPIYRLRFDGAGVPVETGSKPTQSRRSRPAAKAAANTAHAEAMSAVADTAADQTVLKKVEEERMVDGKRDLLSAEAADELGPRDTSKDR